MNDIIQLSDLFYFYPGQKDPDIQGYVSDKKEMRELKATGNPLEKVGNLFKNQELVVRLMLFLDRLLLIARAGAGKTCSAVGAAEQFKEGMDRLAFIFNLTTDFLASYITKDRTEIKKIYIISRNKLLLTEFQNQIVNNCTNDPQYKESEKNLKKYYRFFTYGEFAKLIETKSESELIADFTNTMVVIDEIAEMNPESAMAATKEKDEEETLNKEKEKKRKEVTYNTINRLVKLVRLKLIAMTATPMLNSTRELGPLLNLLNGADNQIPSNFDFDKATLEEYEPYMRGLISYVREAQGSIVESYQGENVVDDGVVYSTISYKIPMSAYQSQVYKYAENGQKVSSKGEVSAVKPGRSAFRVAERQAANFVLPNFEYESALFSKYVTGKGDRFTPIESFDREIKKTPVKYAAKFVEAIKILADNPGSAYAFSNYRAMGAIGFSIYLKSIGGYEQFYRSESVFNAAGKLTLKKGLRFALILSTTPQSVIDNIIALSHSRENVNGEYLKLVVVTPFAQVGISLFNVVTIIKLDVSWIPSDNYQALARAIRVTGHDFLKEQRLAAGITDPIEVKIYNFEAIMDDGSKTVDRQLYKISEERDRLIKRVERFMKILALDCNINKARNVLPGDVNGSPICDYEQCNYQCYQGEGDLIVDSYDVLYSDNYVNQIIDDIVDYLTGKSSIFLDDLYYYFESRNVEIRYVDMAVSKIITDKITIYNRYGYSCYVVESDATLFLQRDYPSSVHDHDDVVYLDSLTINDRMSIKEYNAIVHKSRARESNILDEHYEDLSELGELVSGYPNDQKIEILEEAIVRKHNKQDNDAVNYILDMFNLFYMKIKEPVQLIDEVISEEAERSSKRGRKSAKDSSRIKATKYTEQELEDFSDRFNESTKSSKDVYIHSLSSQSDENSQYNSVIRTNKAEGVIRVLKPDSDYPQWRDALRPGEQEVYNKLMQYRINKYLNSYDIYDIYGIISKGKLIIRRRKSGREEGKNGDCSNLSLEESIDLMYELNIIPTLDLMRAWEGNFVQGPRAERSKERRDEIIRFFDTKSGKKEYDIDRFISFNDDKLLEYYRWYKSKLPRPVMCQIIRSELSKRNKSTGRNRIADFLFAKVPKL